MDSIETIDLLSSDSDCSSSDDIPNIEDKKQSETSFVTKRMNQVTEEGSTILFEDEEVKKDEASAVPKKRFPISTELLSRKRVRSTEEDRINASIPHKRSTFSGDINDSVPSALKELGVTEEEDKQNTSEVRHILNNYSNQNDVSLHNLLNSILSDADVSDSSSISEEHSNDLVDYQAHSLDLSEDDLSVLHPHSLDNSQFSSVIISESDPSSLNDNLKEANLVGENNIRELKEDVNHVEEDKSTEDDSTEDDSTDDVLKTINNSNKMTSPPKSPPKSSPKSPPKSLPKEEEIDILSLSSDSDSEDVIPANHTRSIENISYISISSDSDEVLNSSSQEDSDPMDPILKQILSHKESQEEVNPPIQKESQAASTKKTDMEVRLDEISELDSILKEDTIQDESGHNFDDYISNYVHGCSQQELSDDSTISDSMSDSGNIQALQEILSTSSSQSTHESTEGLLPKPISLLKPTLLDSTPFPKPISPSKPTIPTTTLPKPISPSKPTIPTTTLPKPISPSKPILPHSTPLPKPTFPLAASPANTRLQKHKTLLVCFEEQLSRQDQGKKIIEAIRPSCIIGPTIHCPAHGLVLIMRQIENQYVIVNDCLTMVMDGNAMISLIKEKGMEGGLSHIKEVRSLLLTNTNQHLYLILTNMQSIIAEQRRKRRQSILPFTKDFLTELYIRLRLDCSVTCFPCESESAATEWMMKIIQCVRDGPYLQPLTELGVVTKSKTIGTTYQDSFNEKELCLFRMLQCIPGVSTTKALAILHHYKSVAELVEAYEQLPTKEMKEDLLSDKMGGNSKQRQLSKRIYESFTCTNGSHEL